MSRERKTGRFSYEGEWDRVCTCGHTLGHHTAEAPHECIESDFSDVDCTCVRFRPSKKKNPRRRRARRNPSSSAGTFLLVATGLVAVLYLGKKLTQ